MMKSSSFFRAVNRIVSIVTVLTVVLTAFSGLRLTLFNMRIGLPYLLRWLDSIALAGNIHTLHFSAGIALMGLLGFKFCWCVIGGFERQSGSYFKQGIGRSLAVSFYLVLILSMASGLIVYHGSGLDALTLMVLKNAHFYSFLAVVALSAISLVGFLLSKRTIQQQESMPPGYPTRVWSALLIAFVFSLATVYGVLTLAKSPFELVSRNINRSATVDGRAYGIEWLGADSVVVPVHGGDNFPGKTTQVVIKSFHNYQFIFFLVQWSDPDRSFNRHLVKADSGWAVLRSEKSLFGESVYYEDQFAVSFHREESGCLKSCHLSSDGKIGWHYTAGDTADLWFWKSVSSNPAREAEDGWWGAKINDTAGGMHFDNSPAGGYTMNLNEEWDEPIFLPMHYSQSDWIWLHSKQFMPYRAGLDSYVLGTRLPAILVAPIAGDKGDVNARGQWQQGRWTLEMSRRLNSGSPVDLMFRDSLWLGLAPFNNSELKHAYHYSSVKLIIER